MFSMIATLALLQCGSGKKLFFSCDKLDDEATGIVLKTSMIIFLTPSSVVFDQFIHAIQISQYLSCSFSILS